MYHCCAAIAKKKFPSVQGNIKEKSQPKVASTLLKRSRKGLNTNFLSPIVPPQK